MSETLERFPLFLRRGLIIARFFTIGHSTRPATELVDLLTSAGVTLLVDVRAFPHSPRNPQFDRDALRPLLERHGIGYVHSAALGGRRGPSALPPAVNGFWRNRSFHNYADYAMTSGFQEALHELIDLGKREACAVMCAEAVWWRCHRRIVADYLLHHGADVAHIMSSGRITPASLTTAAVPDGSGLLSYPGNPSPITRRRR